MGRRPLIGLSAVTDVLLHPVGHPQAAAAASVCLFRYLPTFPCPTVVVAQRASPTSSTLPVSHSHIRNIALGRRWALIYNCHIRTTGKRCNCKAFANQKPINVLPLISPKSLSDWRFSVAKTDRVWQEAAGSR